MFFEAGIENHFSGHSTRSASASKQFYSGVLLDQIMRQVNWSRGSTFNKFYKKKTFASTGMALEITNYGRADFITIIKLLE